MATTYAVNEAKVISETLDGEAIVINMETGTYYSLNATGSAVWEGVKAGYACEEIARRLARGFEVEEGAALASVRAFVGTLATDGLVEERDGEAATGSDDTSGPRLPFVEPTITRYEDMQEMLLADPIHDVDAQGWPVLKQP